jgi:peptidylprolyl isomerase
MKALMPTAAVCLALAVAGCGSSDDSTSDSTESSGSTAAESTTAKKATTAKKTKPKVTVPKGAPPKKKTQPKVEVPKGAPPKKLVVEELEEGTGAEAKSGDEVTVQYVGVNFKSGEKFESSWENGMPLTFPLGVGQVIPGWDQGVEGMKIGGRRELIIPPNLAYGATGSPPTIPPNETLVFVIDLLEVN